MDFVNTMFLGGMICNFTHFVSTGCMNLLPIFPCLWCCDHVYCLLRTKAGAVFERGAGEC